MANKKTANNMDAEKLKAHYEQVYQKGAYENYFTFNSYWIWQAILDAVPDWREKDVLEVGCGQGELSALLSYAGAKSVAAIDYSETAVELASQRVSLPNVEFSCVDGYDATGTYDVVTLAGVLEHIDDPWKLLDKLIDTNLTENGTLVTVMPSFMNPRGYIWMTLQMLFDVPMSLSDLHNFSPTDIKKYASDKNLDVKISTFDADWGCGERLLLDYKKRLPNALKDAGLETKNVDKLIAWLDDATQYYTPNDFSGALMVCALTKQTAPA